MAVSAAFREHALDLLASAGAVTARSMFGGVGLYVHGLMFALLDDDDIFLKVDDECREAFRAAGCAPWIYPGPKGPTEGGYYRPPDAAHDSAEEMLPWAKLAIGAARRVQAAKLAKASRKAEKKPVVRAATGQKPTGQKPASKNPASKKPASKKPASKKPTGGRATPAKATRRR